MKTESHPATNPLTGTPQRDLPTSRCMVRYAKEATNTPTMAILKMFAPKASSPPSWKINAWTPTTVVRTRTAAHGPSRMAARAAPSRWPEVPPATVKFSIWPAKMQAARTPMSGTWRSSRSLLTRFRASAITTIADQKHDDGDGHR